MERSITVISLICAFCITCIAIPPEPPVGMRWVLQQEFSDEFNGTELNREKWNTFYDGWKGRPPGWFNPDAVSLADGLLQIKSGILEKPMGPYTMYGGAVTSRTDKAYYGYYECRAKASRIKMSTTFWMSNDKVPFKKTRDNTDSYSQELDILECVGGSLDSENPGFRKEMHSNTHFRYIHSGETREEFFSIGAKKELRSEVWEEFHTYGAWWMDEEAVKFYADDEFFNCIHFSKEIHKTPFDRPMQINMVTETYDWQPPPSKEELLNDEINTAVYDWVRSYELVPVDKKYKYEEPLVPLYTEEIEVKGVSSSLDPDKVLSFTCAYKANQDRLIQVQIVDADGKVIDKETVHALAGYGKSRWRRVLEPKPVLNRPYYVMLGMLDAKTHKVIDSISKKVVWED